MNEKTFWFKRKKYGYGWTPCSWQGWLLTISYIVLAIAPVAFSKNWYLHYRFFYYIYLAFLTGINIFLTLKHAPKGRWSWGDDS
jgi:hypothetical protein